MKNVMFAVVLGIIFSLLYSCNKEEPIDLIEYQILREWKPKYGVGMELLVSEDAKKEDIMKLAKYLRHKYKNRSFINIDIFDNRDTWQNRDNQNYPEEEYFKHYLVNMVRNKNTGYDEIKWVAVGRPIK